MSITARVLIALGILFVDLVVFFVPLTACFVAYVLVARPDFFKAVVDEVYSDEA